MDPRDLPGIDAVLSSPPARDLLARFPRDLLVTALREAIDEARRGLLAGRPASDLSCDAFARAAADRLDARLAAGPVPVVNATGTVLHTNLGRAPLGRRAREALDRAAAGPTALEFDLDGGARGERDDHVAGLLRELTGAGDAVVVNNNAAALLLVVDTLAERREVVVSRGEMIEIGGAFRLPDVLRRAGAVLCEVGTTNRTRLEDYALAIGRRTGLVLRCHPSNYRVEGFVERPPLDGLARLARERGVPLLDDLGSGALADLSRWGLPREPMPADSIRAGANLVSFSGDKLLGGPQAGIVAGDAALVERLRRNPLKRALRVDKLTIAALAATLATWRCAPDPARELPALGLLARPVEALDALARAALPLLAGALSGFALEVVASEAEIGSGAQPGARLPSRAIAVSRPGWDAGRIAALFRSARPAILGRILHGRFLLDVRAVAAAEDLVPRSTGAESR